MNLRVTSQTRSGNAIADIRTRSSEVNKYLDQLSSGVRVQRASDDPSSFPALAIAKAAANRYTSYGQNVASATTTLNSGVSVLQDINNVLVRAKNIALEANNGNVDGEPTSREALATEVDGLIDRAIQVANSQPDGKSLFAGTAQDTLPFRVATVDAQGRPATVAYGGSADRARTITGRGTTVDTRYVGSAVLQQPGSDVFASLIALRDSLRGTLPANTTYNQALTQNIASLDAARTAVGEQVGEQSSNLATLDDLQSLIGDAGLAATQRAADLEGTDYASAVVKFQEQQTALQAVYAVTAKLADPGLLSFIG